MMDEVAMSENGPDPYSHGYPDTPITKRIKNDFTYHRPPAEVQAIFVTIREKAKELALLIAHRVPSGREQSTALTRLEEAVMHANAGIARQYPTV